MTATLPRLLDRRQIAEELGVTIHAAEQVMRHCNLIRLGRRVYVTDTDAKAALNRLTIQSTSTSSNGITCA